MLAIDITGATYVPAPTSAATLRTMDGDSARKIATIPPISASGRFSITSSAALTLPSAMFSRIDPVHGSDSPEAAKRELAIYFKPTELFDYEPTLKDWVCAGDER